jgi:hypothetical protein
VAVKCSWVLRIKISDTNQNVRAIATRLRLKGRGEEGGMSRMVKWEWNMERIPLFQCYSISEEGCAVLPLSKDTLAVKHELEQSHEQRLGAKLTRPLPQRL